MVVKKTIKHILLLTLILILIPIVFANNPGDHNQSVTTKVNVTDAPPYITSVYMPDPINLVPGGIKEINCTVELYDFNGWQTVKLVNATLWDNNSVTMNDPDINITHYTNTNCTQGTIDEGPYNRTYYCAFNISYYAYNSSDWICNATSLDNSTYNFTDTKFNSTTISPLYAVNVTTEIDFGEGAVGDKIGNKTANITNYGNQPINISVQGYGNQLGDGLAMDCDINGNISIDNLEVSWNTTTTRMILDGSIQNVTNITIPKINQAGIKPNNYVSTYWDLYISPIGNPFGLCTGTVIFTAWNSI